MMSGPEKSITKSILMKKANCYQLPGTSFSVGLQSIKRPHAIPSICKKHF